MGEGLEHLVDVQSDVHVVEARHLLLGINVRDIFEHQTRRLGTFLGDHLVHANDVRASVQVLATPALRVPVDLQMRHQHPLPVTQISLGGWQPHKVDPPAAQPQPRAGEVVVNLCVRVHLIYRKTGAVLYFRTHLALHTHIKGQTLDSAVHNWVIKRIVMLDVSCVELPVAIDAE